VLHVTGGAVIKDSGQREEFHTGSRRDTREGKGRFDLLPPHGLTRLAKHFEAGAKKYGDNNWTRGQPHSRFMDSAARHLFKHLAGESDEDHLIAAAWNLICAADQEERILLGMLDNDLHDAGPDLYDNAPLYRRNGRTLSTPYDEIIAKCNLEEKETARNPRIDRD
jgi:hypothetical protein